MNYIQDNLSRGEDIIYSAQITWLSQTSNFVGAIFIFFMGIIVSRVSGGENVYFWAFGIAAIIQILYAVIQVLSTELAFTNKRVITKSGILSRNTLEIRLEKVESISFSQGILGRMFNYGSVIVRGTGMGALNSPSISNPIEFKNRLNDYLDEFQKQKK